MSNDVAIYEELKGDLVEHGIDSRLPPHITRDQFTSVIVMAVNEQPELLECNRASLINEACKAADDGLLPDGRQGVLTFFKNNKKGILEAQWIPMVQGIIMRAREKGDLFSIDAQVVHANDKFERVLGDNPQYIHKPAEDDARGAIVGAYAIFKAPNKEVIGREYMSLKQIQKVKSKSRNPNGLMWKDFFEEGCRKTVIRRGSKYIPLSPEVRKIIERDDVEYDLDDGRVPDEEVEATETKAEVEVEEPPAYDLDLTADELVPDEDTDDLIKRMDADLAEARDYTDLVERARNFRAEVLVSTDQQAEGRAVEILRKHKARLLGDDQTAEEDVPT